jgi:hypothetical protein
MRSGYSSFAVVCLWIALLSGCTPGRSTPETPGATAVATPTIDLPQPTDTPDVQAQIEAATLLSIDFETGFPFELYDWSESWQVQNESDSNAVFCSQISDDWSSFLFGLDEWENYALSLRAKFLSDNPNQGAEAYVRINSSIDGYRASIFNNEWAAVGYYPPASQLGGASVQIEQNEWIQFQVQFVGEELEYFLNDELVLQVRDDRRDSGRAGFGAAPNTEVCVDDILVWGLDENGIPLVDPGDLVVEPYDGTVYSIQEKVDNKRTIPVFYPWSSNCEHLSEFYFDCDTEDTPYGLVWIGAGLAQDLESTQPAVSAPQRILMQSDGDTLYLISEQWHYWYPGWRTLSPDSPFYLDEVYQPHIGSEYDQTLVINFTHPEWPALMAEKALNFKIAGFDGMMLDWWHNGAGNGRSEEVVEAARVAISKAIRMRVGDDFILMGNVNWGVDDPTAQYLSGVFLELWKSEPAEGYALTYSEENEFGWNPSIERMEDLLIYWDTHLLWPKIIAFEPWKITTDDYVADRYTEENLRYARLFAAMAVVIPENGYILYADNNDDWDGGDHQHAYYDFYLTDFGKPISDMVTVVDGMAYKRFERGLIAYNRTTSEVVVRLPYGKQFTIGPLQGLFLEGYFE